MSSSHDGHVGAVDHGMWWGYIKWHSNIGLQENRPKMFIVLSFVVQLEDGQTDKRI